MLGEYPFRGLFPIIGGGLLGVVVASVPRAVLRGRVSLSVGLAAAALGALGEVKAVNIDAAHLAPWTWEGYAAVTVTALVGVSMAWMAANEATRDRSGNQN